MHPKITLYARPRAGMTSWFEMVDYCVEKGIQNLETLSVMELSAPDVEFAKKLKDYCDKKDIKIVCVSVGGELVGEDEEAKVKRMQGYADVAKILGAPYLHHTIVFNFWDPDSILANKEDLFTRGIACARQVYDYAKSVGIQAICEEQGYIFNGVAGYGRFLETVDRAYGTVADFGNIRQAEEHIEEFIASYGSCVRHAHLKDVTITSKKERPIGQGEFLTLDKNYMANAVWGQGDVNMEAGIKALLDAGYTGYYAIESDPSTEDAPDYFEQNLAYADQLLTKLGVE